MKILQVCISIQIHTCTVCFQTNYKFEVIGICIPFNVQLINSPTRHVLRLEVITFTLELDTLFYPSCLRGTQQDRSMLSDKQSVQITIRDADAFSWSSAGFWTTAPSSWGTSWDYPCSPRSRAQISNCTRPPIPSCPAATTRNTHAHRTRPPCKQESRFQVSGMHVCSQGSQEIKLKMFVNIWC